MFDKLLLIACVCVVVALILYFFYWNRFIAFLIGQVIRIFYWNQEGSRIWVEIGSIHFSLLAGRILLKDVKYHSSNQTVKVVKGQIQWRYWIRRPATEEELSSIRGEVKHSGRLWSCRIQLSFQGVEWFIHNRTAAYDNIIAQMEKSSRPPSSHRRFFDRFAKNDGSSQFYPPSAPPRPALRMPSFIMKSLAWLRDQLPKLDPMDLLPLGVDIQTGAILLGNASTPSLLVAEFQNAFGTYGIVPSRSKYDLYKQVLNLRFQSALIRLVNNDDFIDPMPILGSLVNSRVKVGPTAARRTSFYQSYRTFTRLWRQLGLYRLTMDYFATRRAQRIAHRSLASSLPGFKKSKAVEEETPIGIDFSTHEYAIERKILEAPALELSYYVDTVGDVPSDPTSFAGGDLFDIGNGDIAPEWGFDLVIFGGVLRYGPWADRQRAELQRAFFPPSYQHNEETPMLRPGDKRLWAALKIFVELREETSLHIPFREASKDWQWDGVAEIPQRPRKREFAFFNVTVGDRSSISYVMPMVVGSSGYESTFEVHLDTITMTSSLNDIRLITAESTRIRGELPAPLHWNGERTWTVAIVLRQPTLYLLRDHINMFTDLGKDWASGPPTDYYKFIPMIYAIRFEMHHFDLNLYVNDQNIIDKPLIREENAMLTLRGPQLKTSVTIPSNTFRPESTSIPFTISAPNVSGNFSLPRWSTHAAHTQKDGISLFNTKVLKLDGSYRYYAEVHEENVEQLKLDFFLGDPLLRAFGWSIRYFLVLKDNYLGSYTHFQTLSEYLDKRNRNLSTGDPLHVKYRPGKSNMLQVEMLLRAERATILLPTSLVGSNAPRLEDPETFNKAVSLSVPEIQLQLRLHDYYMEMSLNLDRISASVRQDLTGYVPPSSTGMSHDILVMDGIDIVPHRLFGPQPRTATYVCIWEIALGDIRASMSANQAKLLAAAGDSFRYNFVDLVNAPAEAFAPVLDPDVTFYKISVKTLELTWKAGHAALFLELSKGLKLDRNDLGAHQYKSVTSLRVPHVAVKVLLTASLDNRTWLEAAEITCDAYLDIYSAPYQHRAKTREQLAFIEEQDRMTSRAQRMFEQLRHRSRSERHTERVPYRNGVFLPQPTLPRPSSDPVKGPRSQRPRPARVRPPSWRLSTLANLSDSDEEVVSEADRDARLARTRTSTPVPVPRDEDDMTMSSGDESDNADLTDGYSSEDWSDTGEASHGQSTVSLLSFYSPLVRRYMALMPFGTDVGDTASFTLIKESAPFLRREQGGNEYRKPESAPELPVQDEGPKDEDLTTFRLKCHGINITFTPLTLRASSHFEEDLKTIIPDPEMYIDSLLGGCIAKISSQESANCSILHLDISKVTLQAVQHLAMLDEIHPNVFKSKESASSPTNLDIVAVLRIDVHCIRFSAIIGRNSPIAAASIGEISGSFDASADKRTLSGSSPKSAILNLVLSSPSFNLSRNNFQADLGTISIEVGDRGPELVSATCLGLASVVTQLLKLTKRVMTSTLKKQRMVIGNILKRSEEKPVIDPLSTIQPSYLVQSGIPQLLRTDMSFRLLYHLRNSIFNIVPSFSDAPPPFDNVDLEDLVPLVEARLSHLDPDMNNIDDLTAIASLFLDQEARATPIAGSRSMDAVGVRLGNARIAILTPADGAPSELVIAGVEIDLHFKKQDLIQFVFNNPSSASQASLRSRSNKVIRKTAIVASIGNIALIVAPHLMHFAQQVLRVKKQVTASLVERQHRKRTAFDSFERMSNTFSGWVHTEIIAVVRQLRLQAAAENLVLVMGIHDLRTATTLLTAQNRPMSTNSSVVFDEIYLQARSPANPARESDHDILAAIAFVSGRSNIVARPDSKARAHIKAAFALNGFKLNVPRSALRLYRFVEEWREDYLPGMEATINALLSEYQALPAKPQSPTPSNHPRQSAIIQVQTRIDLFEISLQVMHGTWLSWEMHDTVAYLNNCGTMVSRENHAFGVQIASMALVVSSKPNVTEAARSSRVKVALPPLSVAGHSEGARINMLILLEFIDLKVKPSHWDTLLSVQQKFGQDFNDLVALMEKTRRRPTPVRKTAETKGKTFQYVAHMKMQGFRIGLMGLSSTVVLECQNINGGFTSTDGWAWDVSLSDLALSLATRVSERQTTAFNRNQRSAFVIIDVKLSGSNPLGQKDKTLHLFVTKIHAVMQPSSIGEFGDFIDNLQAELLERQEQRALELAAFKDKAQSILKTFDVVDGDIQLEQGSLLDDMVINISIHSVGVAFPLTHDEELQLPRRKGKESVAVRAFLFCIKSVEFTTTRGETGHATMKHLSFQFVSRFKQSSPEDFAAEKHQTRNCLLYPEMQAQVRASSTGSSRKIWIKADVSGFILDIDSNIPSYVFSLIDVYRQGKERVDRLSAIPPRTPLSAVPAIENVKPSIDISYNAVPTSNVFAKLTFLSGKVRFYSVSASAEFRNRASFSRTTLEIGDDQVLDLGAEVFKLPVVSVWGEYRATPASQKVSKGSEQEPSLLMFNSTVFSSQNTLRPTLLPFLTELVTHIETRMRKVSSRIVPASPAAAVPLSASTTSFNNTDEPNSVSSMQICFSLRIDKSKLELTCQPDVNVVAGLHWESGGFIVNVSPGARKVTFSGSVSGLTVGLKHGFLSEDCVKLDARNLAFNLSFAKTEQDGGESVNSISIVLDTEFLGGVRFSRLQDILCFKAVWLDRIPILNSQSPSEPRTPIRQDPAENPPFSRGFSTSVLLRIRQIALEVDLGQSISRLNLDLHQTTFRTQLADDLDEVFLHIADVSIVANGNISGHARVPSCVFQTIRRSRDTLQDDHGKSRMLELRLTTGSLVADFESDLQKLLHYRADPLKVEIFDDWSETQAIINDESRPLHLSFTVTCREVVAVATVGTIPKLLSYMNKFKANLDIQRQGAFRESQTFRVTRTPKPDNPLSAVAEAMLLEARSRFKEAGISFVVRQHMSLHLDMLRLIVFPRTMRDLEIAQFIGNDVRARLDGLVISDSPSSKRDLHLSFSSMVISKYNQNRPVYLRVERPEGDDGREWLASLLKDASEANIVGLPSMKMHMITEESMEDSNRVLTYDFFSEFVRREGMKAFEDIYITLNMSLYAWLTVLRKNLTREMEQVRATEDWRTSVNAAATAISSGPRKKKIPEPLSLTEQPRSASLPAAQSMAMSPTLSPLSARGGGWHEGSRTPQSARENSLSPTSYLPTSPSPLQFPSSSRDTTEEPPISQALPIRKALVYKPRNRHIERLTMRQLGEATPDVMHPFFMKKAGFSLEDSLPQYVHEYATAPLEEIMEVLLKLYSRQLLAGAQRARSPENSP